MGETFGRRPKRCCGHPGPAAKSGLVLPRRHLRADPGAMEHLGNSRPVDWQEATRRSLRTASISIVKFVEESSIGPMISARSLTPVWKTLWRTCST